MADNNLDAALKYLKDNTDVTNAFTGTDYAGNPTTAVNWAKQHYDKYGVNEGRTWGTPAPPPPSNTGGGAAGAAPNMPTTTPIPNPGVSNSGLVEKRLPGLLDRNNQFIQGARTRGMLEGAERGLQNASIAAGTGEKQAIAAAGAIAGQDASTTANSDLAYQNYLQGRESTILAGNVSSNLEQQKIDAEKTLLEMKTKADEAMATLNLAAEDRKNLGAAMDGLGQQYMANYTSIYNSPDYASPAEKTSAIEALTRAYQANVNMMTGFYGSKVTWIRPDAPTTGGSGESSAFTADRTELAKQQYGQEFATWLQSKTANGGGLLDSGTNYQTAPLATLYQRFQSETAAR